MGQDERRVAAELSRGQGVRAGDEWTITPSEQLATYPAAPAGPLPGSVPAAGSGRVARGVREVVETLLLALVIFVGVRLIVLNFRVDGDSMLPNLHNREMLLVNRNAYLHFDLNNLRAILPGEDPEGEDVWYPFDPPERGDIVVFNPPVDDPEKPYIKRVIGLPGERITFRDGAVFINGVQLDEPYIDDGITDCRRNEECRVTVEEGHVFVLGDNRENSSDSRSFSESGGLVAVEEIIGKAWFSYWPLGDIGFVPHYDYPDVPDRPMRPARPLATPEAPAA